MITLQTNYSKPYITADSKTATKTAVQPLKTFLNPTYSLHLLNLKSANRNGIKIARTVSFGKSFDDSVKAYFPHKTPDEYQLSAIKGLYEGEDVLVSAPTGTGKTAIAEYAIAQNLDEGHRTFYTTPLKALSNQKYIDFQKQYGAENVGLLTGDIKEKPDAPVVIMTTEIYNNMLKNQDHEQLENVKTVVFDEVHYMNDPERGRVWEESLILTPPDKQVLPLSATIGNVDEIADWIGSLKAGDGGSIEENKPVVIDVPESARHVPLSFSIYDPSDKKIIPLEEATITKSSDSTNEETHVKSDQKKVAEIVTLLHEENKDPVIIYIFNRRKCNNTAQYLKEGIEKGDIPQLLDAEKAEKVDKIITKLEEEDAYFGVDFEIKSENGSEENSENGYKYLLKKGIAVHHAGMLPAYKNLVEQLASEGLIKTIVATSTVGAGVNFPVKTTVFTSLKMPSSTQNKEVVYRDLTPSEFKQMAGRAGRRGLDDKGHVVVIKNDKNTAGQVSYYKNAPADKIRSNFFPSYNFLLSRLNGGSMEELNQLIKKSFLHFQSKNPEGKKQENLFRESINSVDSKINIMYKTLSQGGFIKTDENDKCSLTTKGKIALKIRGANELFVTEVIESGVLNNLSPENLAGIAATFNENKISYSQSLDLNKTLLDNKGISSEKLKTISEISKKIKKLQKKAATGLSKGKIKGKKAQNTNFNEIKIAGNVSLYEAVYDWAKGESFENVIQDLFETKGKQPEQSKKIQKNIHRNTKKSKLKKQVETKAKKPSDFVDEIPTEEGAFIRTVLRTVDYLNQIHDAADMLVKTEGKKEYAQLRDNAEEAIKLIHKEPAKTELKDYNIREIIDSR